MAQRGPRRRTKAARPSIVIDRRAAYAACIQPQCSPFFARVELWPSPVRSAQKYAHPGSSATTLRAQPSHTAHSLLRHSPIDDLVISGEAKKRRKFCAARKLFGEFRTARTARISKQGPLCFTASFAPTTPVPPFSLGRRDPLPSYCPFVQPP